MVEFIERGDIWEAPDMEKVEAIVIPVNTVGVAGAGLAKEFKVRYPKRNEAYVHACFNDKLKIAQPLYLYPEQENLEPSNCGHILFPTKLHFKENSHLHWLAQGLRGLLDGVCGHIPGSVAWPKIGCGLGGLSWSAVLPVMLHYLEPHAGTHIIYV